RDIAVHHRKTECDAQFAPILTVARRHGMAVPHVERLIALMREVESGTRPQALENLILLASA
ncbi:MAG TPA: ketopantoate reductase C-terminal domain-containing protein, partial [Vicinamibacterales bacterium]|nr:ketopantoate reductase C-terminal domain-containing protein [Vicinamibacterales bacterium]